MARARGEKEWWGLMALALMLALLGGAVRAESDYAAWVFDLLARAEQQQPTRLLDFLPGMAKDQPVLLPLKRGFRPAMAACRCTSSRIWAKPPTK